MIAGLLLAAGESTRMGSPKPLLDWHGRPLVRYQAEQLRKGGCDLVVIVLGYRADRVLPFVDGLAGTHVVINPDYRQGRATSVRAGAAVIPPGVRWVMDLGVDQPRPARSVREVVKALADSTAAIVIPTYRGRHGHPTAFAGRLLQEIREVQDATLGLRAVVQQHEKEIQEVEASSDAVLLDVNTADEYVKAVGAR
jgi:molybdenum cofactor cytidylyltransferase